MHQFCIDNNGIAEGPYTVQEILSMNLPPETMILDSETGEWKPLSSFDMASNKPLETDEAEEFLLKSGAQPANNGPDNNQSEKSDMTEEEFQEWRAKRRERIAKEERRSNRFGGLIMMVFGLAVGGVGVLISVLLEDRIMIGLILTGVALFIGGAIALATGKEIEMDD